MRFALRTIRNCSLAATLALLPACQPPAPSVPVDLDLAHFDGAIDHTRVTDDPAKSALYVRASKALETGNAAAAEAMYRKAVADYPADADGYEALGACLYFQTQYDEARVQYRRALQLDPRSADAHYGLGCVAFKQGQNAEARDFLELALEAREEFALCHRVLAFVYDELRDGAKALVHFERAAALDKSIAADEHVRRRIEALKR